MFHSAKQFIYNLKVLNIRFYSLKYERSLIGYKQMPDVFYNFKRKKLPLKIYTAIAKFAYTFSDSLTDKLMIYQYRYDITFPALLNKLQIYRFQKIKQNQIIPSDAIDELGVELCVAHLVVHMGGAIRVKGSDQWIGHTKANPNLLPRTRIRDFKIEAIDLSGTLITYEGLEYLPSLSSLKELRVNTAAFLDDHCLRRVSRMRRHLELLDISNCPQISGKGLATLWNLRNLRSLNLADNPFLDDKQLVCILLMEKIPLLQIQGVDYLESLTSQQKDNIRQLYHRSDEHDQITTGSRDAMGDCGDKETDEMRVREGQINKY